MKCEIYQRSVGSNESWCRLCARSCDRWLTTTDNDGSNRFGTNLGSSPLLVLRASTYQPAQ